MSYILDALKRAESERSRGAVPNLHAQPDLGGEPDARGTLTRQLGWGLIALTIGVLAAGTWWWFSGDERDAQRPADVMGDAHVPVMPTPPMPVAVTAARPAAPAVSLPPATVAVGSTSPPARLPPAAGPTPKPSPAAATTAKAPVERPSAQASAARVVKAIAASPASSLPSAAEERVYTLRELPDDIRSSLPALTVGGATYSENPANRMLIVNGQLFHEGDQLAPELTLQQIKLRSAVLNFRGYRYGISY